MLEKMKTRLEASYPQLMNALAQSSSRRRRLAAIMACEVAMESLVDLPSEVRDALDVIKAGRLADEATLRAVKIAAEQLDEEYFALTENGNKITGSRYFFKARVAAAVAFFGSGYEQTAEHEAIYEAVSSLREPASLLRKLMLSGD
jgi:hypothetical protein